MTEPDMFLCAEDRETLAKIRARLAKEEDPGVRLLRAIFEGDPLDEDDHGARHFPMGDHLRRLECGRWHSLARACDLAHYDKQCTLEDWDRHYGPLTFCDCPC